MRYFTLAVLGAAMLGLCGCGTSHQAALPSYSVPQVETAFQEHGLQLHQARFGPAPGVVRLRHNGVSVEVYTGSKSESRLVILVAGERNTALRNLTVEWMPRHTRAVHAALRQLRSHA